MPSRPAFTLGIEEEYLIVDRATRDLVRKPDPGFMESCRKRVGDRVSNEYMQCQAEIGTRPHARMSDNKDELLELRTAVSEAAAEFGYAPIASSTHPFAKWRVQTHTRKERYDMLRSDMGQTARRLLICGMHNHVGIEQPDLRIDLMNQVVYFLPHLLAFSCSSPFWEGEDTSLTSYRLTVFDALPRTGMPDRLSSHGEYRRLVDQLTKSGCIEDATKIWWDIRPSAKFPTIEQRITDVCSTLDDAISIASTFQSLVAFLFRLRSNNQSWRIYPPTLVSENRWRAQRYGSKGKLVDFGKGELVETSALTEELIEIVGEDAEELGCLEFVEGLRRIIGRGNSAERQRDLYKRELQSGANESEALAKVVDHLVAEFLPD
ncbi:MAG: carboxylate-amine ligase [Albidovulum sp.]|nr:carboxylate-amine ligase [Albidovulum sp.]